MNRWFKIILSAIILATTIFGMVPANTAHAANSVAPQGFCSGGIAWEVPPASSLENPICGPGNWQVFVYGVKTTVTTFQAAWDHIAGRSASIWFEPAPTPTPTPITSTAPANFCNGGVPWNVPLSATLVNPNCGSGTWQVIILGVKTAKANFDEAYAFINKVEASIWFEPTPVVITPTPTPTPIITPTPDPTEPTPNTNRVFLSVIYGPPAVPVSAPAEYCSGSTPWSVKAGQTLANPNCGPGKHELHVFGTKTAYADFDQAEAARANRDASYWYLVGQ